MKSKLPDTVKISGHTYRVVNSWNETTRKLFKKDPSKSYATEGETDHHGQIIYIYPDVPHLEAKLQILIHEILHCIDYHTASNRLYNKPMDVELRIEILASGIFQFFKDNPKLLCLMKLSK